MDEAIEICKLRLFLKMVAQIEDVKQIEPLPDIDFNIQAGNTLVGFATDDEIEKALSGRFDFDNLIEPIREKAEDIKERFTLFQKQQTKLGGVVTADDKQMLQQDIEALEDELNRYLAGIYDIDPSNKRDYKKWENRTNLFTGLLHFTEFSRREVLM